MAGLGDAYFLRTLRPRELKRIEAITRERDYGADEVIIAGNSVLKDLYIVRTGRVRVSVPVERREHKGKPGEEVLAHLGAGECFGEFSFADRKPTSATVIADEPTRTFLIAYEELDAVLASDPSIACKVLGSMLATVVGRLRSTDAELLMARYVLYYV